MEKRKLASVQYVHDITPIEGADKIECVHVLGWQCVANKGQFKIGDHVFIILSPHMLKDINGNIVYIF